MSKQFQVEPGFIVRVGRLWHDSNVLLFVEEDEQAEIYVANKGEAGCCLGVYAHAQLRRYAPPIGLRPVDRSSRAGVPTATVIGQASCWMPSWTAAWSGPRAGNAIGLHHGVEVAEPPQGCVIGERHRAPHRGDAVLA